MSSVQPARPSPSEGTGLSRRLTVVLAVACGAVVANLYYAQPLLHAIATGLHTSAVGAGLVVTLSQVGYAVGLAFVVPLGDIARRRWLLVALLGVAAVSLVAAAAAPTLALLGVAMTVAGLSSVVAQILIPLAATLANDRARGQVVGTVMTGLLLGVLLARTAAGLVAQLTSWRVVFLVAAGVMVALAGVLAREVPDLAPVSSLRYPQLLLSVGRLIRREPVLRRRCLLGGLGFAAFSVFWTSMAFLLSGAPYHYSPVVIGLFGLAGAAGALAAGRAGRLGDRGHAGTATVGFATVTVLAFAVLAAGTWSLAAVIVGVVLLDLGVQGLQVTNQSEIYRLAPQARSRVTTAYMTSYFIGGAAGSAAGAGVYGAAGWGGVCALGGGIALVALAVGLFNLWRPARAGGDDSPGGPAQETAGTPGSGGVLPVWPGATVGAPQRR